MRRALRAVGEDDRGSTIPLIFGFFLIAAIMVGGSIALGQAFVQQRELQDTCDGAAVAAAATSIDVSRSGLVGEIRSLRFAEAQRHVDAYLARDPSRRTVRARTAVSKDGLRVSLACTETRDLVFGSLFDRSRVTHHATSTARSAVVR